MLSLWEISRREVSLEMSDKYFHSRLMNIAVEKLREIARMNESLELRADISVVWSEYDDKAHRIHSSISRGGIHRSIWSGEFAAWRIKFERLCPRAEFHSGKSRKTIMQLNACIEGKLLLRILTDV